MIKALKQTIELKRATICRRIDLLLEGFNTRILTATDADRSVLLVDYIDLCIDALKNELPDKNVWMPYSNELLQIRSGIVEEVNDEAIFQQAIFGFRNTILSYKAFIGTYEFDDFGGVG